MPSRRGAIQMTEEEEKKYLEDGFTIEIASIGPRGYPHQVAMWYVVIDGLVTFTTFRKSQKILNLKRDPKVSAMLESGRGYSELRGLVIEGDAEIVDDLETTNRTMAIIGKKYGNLPGAPTDGSPNPLAGKRVTVRIHPQKVFSWDHTKLGGRY